MIRRIVVAVLVATALFGCAKDGVGAHVNRDKAITIAKRQTPLSEIDRVEGSTDLPFRHVINGKDVTGSTVVVWVKTEVTMWAYLDELIPQGEAISLAQAAGLQDAGEGLRAELGHQVGHDERVYWHVSNGAQYVTVDARSGKPLRSNLVDKPPTP